MKSTMRALLTIFLLLALPTAGCAEPPAPAPIPENDEQAAEALEPEATMPTLEGTIQSDGRLAESLRTDPGGIAWSEEITRPESKFLRIHFDNIKDEGTADYRIVGRTSAGEAFDLTKSDLASRTEVWTPLIDGGSVLIEVKGAPDTDLKLSFKLSEFMFQSDSAAPLSLIGHDDRQAIAAFSGNVPVRTAAKSVARLSYVKNGKSYVCTGFLIAADLLLTNEHCVHDASVCATTTALFGYDSSVDYRFNPRDQYTCTKVESVDHGLDYALLRINGRRGDSARWGALSLDPRAIVADEKMYMIQHPAGEAKQVSRIDCSVKTKAGVGRVVGKKTDFGHSCDTLGGSSGSPMMSDGMKVIGLHHLGANSDGPWKDQNRAVSMLEIHPKIRHLLP